MYQILRGAYSDICVFNTAKTFLIAVTVTEDRKMFILALITIFTGVQCVRLASDINIMIAENSGDHLSYHKADKMNTYSNIPGNIKIDLFIDPENGTFSPTALGVYFWTSANYPDAQIYYTLNGSRPGLGSLKLNSSSPYIEVLTPMNRVYAIVRAIAAYFDTSRQVWYRSKEIIREYRVESGARPHRFEFNNPHHHF